MVIAVPLFAVVVTLIDDYANAKLAQKGLSDDLDDYYDDDDEGFVKENESDEQEKTTKPRLSKRYYLDRVRFMITPKAKRGKKPQRTDYLILPSTEYEDEEQDALLPDEAGASPEGGDSAVGNEAVENAVAAEDVAPEALDESAAGVANDCEDA